MARETQLDGFRDRIGGRPIHDLPELSRALLRMSKRPQTPDSDWRGQGGFVVSLTLLLFLTVVVIGSITGIVALRNGIWERGQRNLIKDDDGNVIGKPVSYDLCEAPQVLCPDPGNGLWALLGVRPDRFTSMDRVYYSGVGCTGTPYLAPPAVPSALLPLPASLSVGYLNALEAVSYGVGAPRGWSFLTMMPTGPGLLYRSISGAVPTPVAVLSVWTSLAPDCAPEGGGLPLLTDLCSSLVAPVTLVVAEEVRVDPLDLLSANLLEGYVPPFSIMAPMLTFTPAAPEDAPVQTSTAPGAVVGPGAPTTFTPAVAEDAPIQDATAPGATTDPGDPVTFPAPTPTPPAAPTPPPPPL